MLQINREITEGKTVTEVSSMIKDIEDCNGSIELLIKRANTCTLSTSDDSDVEVEEKPRLLKRLSSWMWPFPPTKASRSTVQVR